MGKDNILQDLFSDIINRDIITRHKIRNAKIAKNLALYLISNIGKEFSYNNLKKMFELGSTNSVISLVSYFEDSYLLFTVPKFDYSFKKQIINPKKIYAIDTGLVKANSASLSVDNGRRLENMVFIALRNKFKEIFYFQENRECDFVIKDGTKITKAIQVCFELNENNKDRELGGMMEALKKFGLKEGLILTYNQEDKFLVEGKEILVIPVWKWMID
ncbi:MAG: ATP-binding protein [archaeon]